MEDVYRNAEAIYMQLTEQDLHSPYQINDQIMITDRKLAAKSRMKQILLNVKIVTKSMTRDNALHVLSKCNGWSQEDVAMLDEEWATYGEFYEHPMNSVEEMYTNLSKVMMSQFSPEQFQAVQNQLAQKF